MFVVADGLGGHVAGRVASETAVGCLLAGMPENSPGDSSFDRLRDACRAAHLAITHRAEAEPRLGGMGTTLAALWFRGDRVALVHLGDSRIYLLRGGELHPLTFDHSVVR